MENSFGVPKRIGNIETLFNNATSECEKAGMFKSVASMALKIFKVPVALVVFTDSKGVINVTTDSVWTDEFKRVKSMNSMAVLRGEVTFPENIEEEIFILANRLVAIGSGFRFFAAVPLITKEGRNIGAFCILDKKQREFPESDLFLLESLASFVVEEVRKSKGSIEGELAF